MEKQKMPGERGQPEPGDTPARQRRKDRRTDQHRPNEPSRTNTDRERTDYPEEESPF